MNCLGFPKSIWLFTIALCLLCFHSYCTRDSEVPERDSIQPKQESVSVDYPEPTGPYPVGVRDFEFVDTKYPIDRDEDSAGRRLMVRVWYPAVAEGERRQYFEGRELEVLGRSVIKALSSFIPNESLLDPLAEVLTHSYVNAPIAKDIDRIPTLVFSHGGLSYVSQNTSLMEDLASHGYLCFSVSHPGGSSGVIYPNGDEVAYDPVYRDAILSLVANPDPEGRGSKEIEKRYKAALRLVDDGGLGPWAPRWRDDMLAVADFIETQDGGDALADIVAKADLQKLAYFGMSYGASAAVSAAQIDQRAVAAVNFDGTHFLSDVLGSDVRVPLLVLSSEPLESYSNEFFFEPLESMGDRQDIVRIKIPDITHMELFDIIFLPPNYREQLPGGGRAQGMRVHKTISGFMRGFFDHYLKGKDNGYPEAQFERFSEVQIIDVSHVKEWAASQKEVK